MKLLQGDCIEIMKTFDSNIIDLTVTSPPYDNLRTYEETCEWNFDIFKQVANELFRITKEGGVVVWVVNDATINGSETGTSFKQALYFKEIGFNLHDTMIWNKTAIMPRDPKCKRYWQKFEYMFIFTKGKINTCNYIYERSKHFGKKAIASSIKENGHIRYDRKEKTQNNTVKEYKIKGNVWDYRPHICKEHPATFPESLANDHIISWSNENDLVFDPFLGSGTTGKMAVLNNRDFIGIEKVEKYFEIAKNRIEEAQKEKELQIF